MKRTGTYAGLTVLVALIGLLGYVVFNMQDVVDWWRLRGYEPPARVQQIAEATTMSEQGQRLFYVNDPQIEDAENFRANCTIAESTIVLGCYDGSGIYVYDVADPRLDGVHEVTAAHEMLHAAYDRLSFSERQRVDVLTAAQFAKITDKRILDVVESYRKRDPSVVPNELHSILGTEVRELDSELEEYYGRYFENRLKVVELSEQYEHVFEENEAKRDSLNAQIEASKKSTLEQELWLQDESDSLNALKARMDVLLAAGRNSEYNDLVPGYNARIGQYNQKLETYKAAITETNRLIAEYNTLVVTQNELIESLDPKANTL